jgi:hypothetical protein
MGLDLVLVFGEDAKENVYVNVSRHALYIRMFSFDQMHFW